jgi:hypothetical protein
MTDDWYKGPHMLLWIISNEVLDQWKLWHEALCWTCLLMTNASQTKFKGSIFSELIVSWCFDIMIIFFGGCDKGIYAKFVQIHWTCNCD